MLMKRTLLTLLVAIATIAAQAQVTFEWGKAEWNIQDGRVYESIEEFNANPVTLTYPNPSGFTLTFFNILAINYDVYIDDATEPIKAGSSRQQGTDIALSYDFPEGHDFRIVVKQALLAQANIATYTTDTLSINEDQYTISFRINGPEIVQTYNAEAIMSLAIVDQEWLLTYSILDPAAICRDLGINDVSEAQLLGLNVNGSYNGSFLDPQYGAAYFDGWRDADGEYTTYWGGYNKIAGHNSYPAVYCIKLNETCDTLKYYFYDFWKEYDPEDPGEIPGSGTETSGVKYNAPQRAPETHYNSIIWDWENEDGTITQYTRNYRVDEGQSYSASFLIKADKKAVKINATMNFVSIEEYEQYLHVNDTQASLDGKPVAYYDLSGRRLNAPRRGFNIVKLSNGKAIKISK